ncbi:MAG TPA: choline/ethanolamine kinase family protein [Sulfurovum sp.]|uniref:choline/ethanolamine kinase family protein n=1 Tax=Sulfurovum sp. TaxID=1969726 RepID=UPI002F9218C2
MIEQLKQYTLFENSTIEAYTLLENQGYCNENYLIHSEEKKYILRKFIRTDIDRAFEFEVQKRAHEIGISAEPLLLDQENALSISTYVEGKHKDRLGKSDLEQFAEVLKKLHALKIEGASISLERLIETPSEEVQNALRTIHTFESETVLCHNDLNPKNVLFADTIRLIDWEYASANDRYFDLASVAVEFALSAEEEAHFLGSYFRTDSEIKYEKLKAYKVIYKALCMQWFDTLKSEQEDQQTPPPQGD